MLSAFDWDDTIVRNKQKVLEPGIYSFTVLDLQKCYHDGSSKIPPCNALNVWLMINDEDVKIFERFFLVSSMQWKIDSFLESVGIEKADTFRALLQTTGRTGMCRLTVRDLDHMQVNNVERFISTNDFEWQQLRYSILDRDGHKCRICGSDKNLRVHHIIEKSADVTHKYNPSNLITLCEECHSKAHSHNMFYKGVF